MREVLECLDRLEAGADGLSAVCLWELGNWRHPIREAEALRRELRGQRWRDRQREEVKGVGHWPSRTRFPRSSSLEYSGWFQGSGGGLATISPAPSSRTGNRQPSRIPS